MVYLNDSIADFSDEQYEEVLQRVSLQRRETTEKFLNSDDRKRSVIAYVLLQEALRNEYNIERAPEFIFNEYGKPFLLSHPDIYFNLSHTENAVACAVSNTIVGIDIETIKPFDPELAEYVLNSEELSNVTSLPNPSVAFTILWTRKESLIKMLGTGLSDAETIRNLLKDFPSRHSFQTTVNTQKGYVMTVCNP